jgi:hypothetical protein
MGNLMSTLRATRLPWKERSTMVGLSTLLFLLPACKRRIPQWKRYACLLQACVSYLSDYHYAGRPHLSHGIDRLVAATNIALTAPRALGTGYDMIATLCYHVSMESIRLRHQKAYELWHSLWHVVGSACLML